MAPLGDGQGASFAVACDLHAQRLAHLSQVGHLELPHQPFLQLGQELTAARCEQEHVVHVQRDDHHAVAALPHVHAAVCVQWGEAELLTQELVRLQVPDAAALPKSVQALLEQADPVLLALDHESFGLAHVHGLLQVSVQECRLDVHVVHLPVVLGGEAEQSA